MNNDNFSSEIKRFEGKRSSVSNFVPTRPNQPVIRLNDIIEHALHALNSV